MTGSNKGIGLAIVRGLCQKFDGDVLLLCKKDTWPGLKLKAGKHETWVHMAMNGNDKSLVWLQNI